MGIRSGTLRVLVAVAAVALLVTVYALRPPVGDQSLPHQKVVRDMPADEQRTFAELQEGVLAAERIRAETGGWPDAAALAGGAIPPFAPVPTRNGAIYRWTAVRQGWTVNYLGIPADPAASAWLLVILEPEPGAPPDSAPNDETHHRLPDGTTLHVSIWQTREQNRRSGLTALQFPQNDGWTQVIR